MAAYSVLILQVQLLLLMLLPLLRALLQASVTRCCKRAYHRRQGSDLRSYDALFITVEPCLGRCCGAETELLAWWLCSCEDYRMPSRFGRREYGTRALSDFSIYLYSSMLFCLVADEQDNEKMRVLIPAGVDQRTRKTALLIAGTFCCLLLLQLAAAMPRLLLLLLLLLLMMMMMMMTLLLLQVGPAAARLGLLQVVLLVMLQEVFIFPTRI